MMKEQNIVDEWHRMCTLFIILFNNQCYGNLFICNSGGFNYCFDSSIELSGFKT